MAGSPPLWYTFIIERYAAGKGAEIMEIRILELTEGAKRAEGLTVVIDVFRAFSLECYLYSRGAAAVFPVGSVEEARSLKEEHPEYVLIGERGGRKCEGFDYGNSPSQTADANLAGKCVVHTTSAGTQGIVNAIHAEEILTGSLVNAKATAAYIKEKNPALVSLVAMGNGGVRTAKEDVLCARYIKSLLTGERLDMDKEISRLKEEGGQHFFRPDTQDVYPMEDFYLCIDRDRFPFILRVEKREDGGFVSVKVGMA